MTNTSTITANTSIAQITAPTDEHISPPEPVVVIPVDSVLQPSPLPKLAVKELIAESPPIQEARQPVLPKPSYDIHVGAWYAQAEAVVGLAHRNKNLPCQDAAYATTASARPMVIVADGAGSGAVSELGSQAVVTGMHRLVCTLNRSIGQVLDNENVPADTEVQSLALTLVKHAKGILTDLAEQHRRSVRDLRCTLLMAVMGTHSMLWLRVGDGALVVQEHLKNTVNVVNTHAPFEAVCRSLGVAEKGEFANETVFLDSVQPSDIQFGWMSVRYVSSVAAMGDGASEKLVSNDGLQIAPKLERLFDTLQQDKLQRQHLTSMFYESSFCEKSTGDDRCLALLARDWKAVNLNEKTTPTVTVATVEDALPPSPQPTNALRSSVNEISSTRKIQKRQRERKKGSI